MEGNPYVFLDESGDFDFGEQGSAYFVVTAVTMRRPVEMDAALAEYRYERLESRYDTEYFHCARDTPAVRRRVFEIIADYRDRMRIDYLVAEKAKTDVALRPAVRFYPRMVGRLLDPVIRRAKVAEGTRIVIVTDRIPVKRTRKAVERRILEALPSEVRERYGYDIHHHESRSHFGLQVADYCCWAIQRKWSRRDERYFALIEPALGCALRAEDDSIAGLGERPAGGDPSPSGPGRRQSD